MVCTNAWSLLAALTPPELTHYYRNDHPGADWWLKCAVPENHPVLLDYWYQLQQDLPDQVMLRPSAWDWHGDLILNCHSVWLCVNVDVQVFVLDDQLQHHIHTYQQGVHEFVTHMQQEISKLPENTAWQDMQEALHLMHTHVSDREARMRRKQFGVIHGKKTTSHKRARPNLDPERPR